MWTPTTREYYSRRSRRYQSDVTDEEWRVIEPYLPPAKATPLLKAARPLFPFLARAFADGGYDHERVTGATSIVVEIVRKLPDQIGFAVLPINRNRRLAKDFEATIASARAFLYAASVMLLVRRIARDA